MEQLCVPWDRLKEWIASQEKLEAETGNPAPLTQSQVLAITQLIPVFEEPDVSDKDYVSLLHQKMQTRRMPAPLFTDLNPVHVGGTLRWRCMCTLKRGEDGFPREGHGVDADQPAPTFQSKKNAKQYAAKFAWQYLESQLPLKTFRSAGSTPPQMSKKSAAIYAASPPSPSKRPFLNAGSSETVLRSMTLAPKNGDETLPSIMKDIVSLAAELGMECPTCVVEEDVTEGFYRGRAEFKNRGLAPNGLGDVTNVFGKKKARERVLEEVLAWMKKQQEARKKLKAEMEADLMTG